MSYPRLTSLMAAGALLASCTGLSYSERVDPRGSRPAASHVPSEIAILAQDLEERASLRSSLGSARILVEALEPIGPRKGRHRFAILDEEDLRAVQDTIRYELEMALGNRLNVLDPDAAIRASEAGAESDSAPGASLRDRLGATHAVVGTFVRNGDLVDIAVRLVDLRDGWIVATAERRIPRFVPRAAVTIRSEVRGEQGGGRRLQRTTAQGDSMEPQPAVEPIRSAPAPQLAAAEPVIPEDATIEFDAGPAAARLGSSGTVVRPLPGEGESNEEGAPAGAPSSGNRGEHH